VSCYILEFLFAQRYAMGPIDGRAKLEDARMGSLHTNMDCEIGHR
jgi:hypothetical protein